MNRTGKATVMEVRAPPAKRLKIDWIPGNADPATRAASALDLESDEVPEQFKCPTCEKVPLGQVYQCSNGHLICQKCHGKQKNKMTCVTCKAVMTTSGGEIIRCRILESILDDLWIACRYKNNGCQEVLSRGQVENHDKHCVYNGSCVQICKYFGQTGPGCGYWSWDTMPDEAFTHLRTHFGFPPGEKRDFYLLDLQRGPKSTLWKGFAGAMVHRQDGNVFLSTMWWTEDKKLSFACIQMNKPTVEKVNTVELNFEAYMDRYSVSNSPSPVLESSTGLIHKWKLTLPTVPLMDAPVVLEHKPVSVSRQFLEKHLFRNPDGSQVKFGHHDKGMVKIVIEIY